MTRREFLAKTAKLLIAVGGLILVAWAACALIGVVLHLSQPLRHWDFQLKNTALAIGLGLLILVALAAAPMAPGAVGGVIFGRRPRRAGAAAGALALVLWSLLALVIRPGDVAHMSWLGWVINGALNLAWWAYWGSVGGAFAAAVRAGWRERGSPKSAVSA